MLRVDLREKVMFVSSRAIFLNNLDMLDPACSDLYGGRKKAEMDRTSVLVNGAVMV